MNDDEIIASLSHPLRRKIFRHIAEKGEPVSPRQLSEELEGNLNNLSYHVRVLRKAGALVLVDQQPVRGSIQHYYLPSSTVMATPWVREVLGLPPADGAER